MTTPIDDAALETVSAWWAKQTMGTASSLPVAATFTPAILERLAKAEAERDAAVAQIQKAFGEDQVNEWVNGGIAEGERRATAAIRAWLYEEANKHLHTDIERAADAIGRGDHLTEAKP